MFGKLKEKLKSWTQKLSKDVEEKAKEKEIQQPKEKISKSKTPASEVGTGGASDFVVETKLNKSLVRSRELDGSAKDSEEPSPEKEKKSFFQKITSKITKIKITNQDFEIYGEELEMLLLENNVALEVAEKIVAELKEKIVGQEFLKKEIEGQIEEAFKDIIREILIEPFNLVDKIKEKRGYLKSKKPNTINNKICDEQSEEPTGGRAGHEPYVILFCGINGTGKTTTIAKIAQQLKDNKLTCVLAAADTFRAAAIDQLKKHGENLDVKVIAHDYGSDPASVGFDAVQYAKKNNIDAVLIDTAGRIHTDKNLMAQIEKINKVTKPDTKIFVGESLTGNDAVEQVKSFDWAIHIDGIILTKADIDEKGGTSLSVGYVTKKPILYLGTGQEYDKIEVFDKEKFIERLGL